VGLLLEEDAVFTDQEEMTTFEPAEALPPHEPRL
jgi:hypothetical protein